MEHRYTTHNHTLRLKGYTVEELAAELRKPLPQLPSYDSKKAGVKVLGFKAPSSHINTDTLRKAYHKGSYINRADSWYDIVEPCGPYAVHAAVHPGFWMTYSSWEGMERLYIVEMVAVIEEGRSLFFEQNSAPDMKWAGRRYKVVGTLWGPANQQHTRNQFASWVERMKES